MRRLLGLVLLLAASSVPAAAQARFLEACSASPDIQEIEGLDGSQLCACVAERVRARGVAGDVLDQSIAYTSREQLADAPPEIQAAAEVAMESTVSCALAQEAGEGAIAASAAAPAPDATAGAPVAPPAPRAVLPAGFRTGDGRPVGRAVQQGKGGVIRIVQ